MPANQHLTRINQATLTDHHKDSKLHMLQRKMHRYAGEGDCAYERALGTLYQKLLEERLLELTALRNAGL